MGASLRHCVAFKREKTMMHKLGFSFCTKTTHFTHLYKDAGASECKQLRGDSHKRTIFDGVVPLNEANMGRANWPHWSMGSDTPGQHVGLRCPECTCNQNWT